MAFMFGGPAGSLNAAASTRLAESAAEAAREHPDPERRLAFHREARRHHMDAATAHLAAGNAAASTRSLNRANEHAAHARALKAERAGSTSSTHPATERARVMHVASHGTASHTTPHDQAMHQATQTGEKGGQFVITSSGKKRYVGRGGR